MHLIFAVFPAAVLFPAADGIHEALSLSRLRKLNNYEHLVIQCFDGGSPSMEQFFHTNILAVSFFRLNFDAPSEIL